jgi:hypothetical protein
VRRATAVINVVKSVGSTSYKKPDRKCVRPAEPTIPTPKPMAATTMLSNFPTRLAMPAWDR